MRVTAQGIANKARESVESFAHIGCARSDEDARSRYEVKHTYTSSSSVAYACSDWL